ncbi:MAG TPA: M28 family peptidase [Terriglobales bacterium]|nr:M28 family peptidase [Terriglobales bacterium]
MSTFCLICLFVALTLCAFGQQPFLDTHQWAALRDESSGAAPYENLRYLTGLHRVPATPEFDQAAQFVLQRAREYGLTNAHSEQFPIDGTKNYGLMRSYLAWTVEEARLWEIRPEHLLLGDWKTDPIRLADYSHTADVETELIDVGNGASEADYSGKDVRGKIVLADGVLARVQELAIARHGAAGIVSDMPNQTTAWSGLDTTVVRWGHLDARQPSGFAFMVSRQTAEALRSRLRSGEPVILNPHVKATVGPGHWTVVTATIPGTDSAAGEIVYSCHLDHERPGANDNGSGCVTILESARVLARLIDSGQLPRPKRTLRFVWGPEVEGTMAFLASHPEIRQRLRANIHMDMVGGDPFKNKSVFHVTGTPWSLPSFVTDVGAVFLDAIRTAASGYAGGEMPAAAGIVETRAGGQGTRNELIADVKPYSAGSDHDDYDSSTIAVPSLYLCDWPDIYIHTDHDTLDQIDATKLRRVALLGAASGYVYASVAARQLPTLLPFLTAQAETRLTRVFGAAQQLVDDPQLEPGVAWYEARNLVNQTLQREDATLHSIIEFTGGPAGADTDGTKALAEQATNFHSWLDKQAKVRGAKGTAPSAPWAGDSEAKRVPIRVGEFGPLTYQNDNVLLARLGKERYAKIKLVNSEATPMLNVRDQSELYAYEIVNFVNGKRPVGEIRDAVSAEYGPLPVNFVADYLEACAEAGVIQWK